MNNARIVGGKTGETPLIIEARNAEEATDKMITGDKRIETATTLRHLSQLRGTVHFQKYVQGCILPEMEKKMKALRSEKDPAHVRYLQGYLDALEKLKDIESFEKIYKVRLETYVKERTRKRAA